MTRPRLAWLAFAVACLLQVIAVYLPEQPHVGTGIPHLDKLVHASIFALPTYLGLRAGRGAALPAVAVAAHAPVSELVQWRLLPHRSGDPWDLLADLVGVVIGLLVWRGTVATADRIG